MKQNLLPVRNLTVLIVLFLLIGISSCKKDPLALPAHVEFEFGMIPLGESAYSKQDAVTSATDTYYINNGLLTFSSMSFEGLRKNADAIYFTANFDQGIIIDLKRETSSQEIEFDIPQGIYERIELSLQLGSPDHLPLVLSGKVSIASQGVIPVRFEYLFPEKVKMVAKSKKGSEIVLKKDNTTSPVRVEVDAEYLFRLINPSLVQKANIRIIDGEKIILINSNNNQNIFNMVAARMENSFTVTFD